MFSFLAFIFIQKSQFYCRSASLSFYFLLDVRASSTFSSSSCLTVCPSTIFTNMLWHRGLVVWWPWNLQLWCIRLTVSRSILFLFSPAWTCRIYHLMTVCFMTAFSGLGVTVWLSVCRLAFSSHLLWHVEFTIWWQPVWWQPFPVLV